MRRIEYYRAMSPDLLAYAMSQKCIRSICDIVCDGDCAALPNLQYSSNEVCRRIIRDWLNEEI